MDKKRRITEEDIEGSIPGDAYCYMEKNEIEVDESAVSCHYCEHISDSIKKAYVHFRNNHNEVFKERIQSMTSEKIFADKIIKKLPNFDKDYDDVERHMLSQSPTNKKICIIVFDVLVERIEIVEETLNPVELELDLGNNVKDETLKELNNLLKDHLKYLKYIKNKDKNEKVYSQNVSDNKLPNVIKKLFADGAISVTVSENKKGNFHVKYKEKETNTPENKDKKQQKQEEEFEIKL